MKPNYHAWQIEVNDFNKLNTEKERLAFLIHFAVLAPSSHNNQPWLFKINENSIEVYRNKSRKLTVADTNDRQLFISIGCAIENICVAADYYGYTSEVEYTNDSDDSHLTAIIHLKKSNEKNSELSHNIFSILTRKTNRNKYKNLTIEEDLLKKIINSTNHLVKVFIVKDKNNLESLADTAVLASIESMVDDEFRQELSFYIKHNLTKSKVGMPGFSLGLPTPISFILPSLIKWFNMEKLAKGQNEALLKEYTPYLVILTTKNDTRHDWLKTGIAFQRIALLANQKGVSVSPWGAPIQIGGFYQSIQKIINTDERPQMFFRMGYSFKEAHLSPRHNAVDMIIN